MAQPHVGFRRNGSMIRRASLRRRLAWAALVILLCSVVVSVQLRRHRGAPLPTTTAECVAVQRDSARFAIFATDTIAALRARRQRVQRFTRSADGLEVRTEDDDPLAAHDGGLAAFDCAGRLTFLWLDGG